MCPVQLETRGSWKQAETTFHEEQANAFPLRPPLRAHPLHLRVLSLRLPRLAHRAAEFSAAAALRLAGEEAPLAVLQPLPLPPLTSRLLREAGGRTEASHILDYLETERLLSLEPICSSGSLDARTTRLPQFSTVSGKDHSRVTNDGAEIPGNISRGRIAHQLGLRFP